MIYIIRQDYETNDEILRRIKVARKMLNVDTNRKSNWTNCVKVFTVGALKILMYGNVECGRKMLKIIYIVLVYV